MPGFEPHRNAGRARQWVRAALARRPGRESRGLLARLRKVRSRAAAEATEPEATGQHAFLVGRLVDAATLARAEVEARHLGQDALGVLRPTATRLPSRPSGVMSRR